MERLTLNLVSGKVVSKSVNYVGYGEASIDLMGIYNNHFAMKVPSIAGYVDRVTGVKTSPAMLVVYKIESQKPRGNQFIDVEATRIFECDINKRKRITSSFDGADFLTAMTRGR